MSLKDLFREQSFKLLPGSSIDQIGSEVESADYIREEIIDQERFIPDVDFSLPDNFVKFGSAEKYYTDSIQRIYNQYPFDGSLLEKQQFYNSSSYLDKYVFDNWYPRTNGYAKFCVNGWGNNLGFSGYNFGDPETQEFIKVFGVMNTGSARVGSNKYSVVDDRTANLRLNGTAGNTIEFWLKKGTIDAAKTEKEVIFDLWNGATVSHAAGSTYGRFLVYLDGSALPWVFPTVTYVSGTVNACTNQAVDGFIDSVYLDDTWHHWAITAKNDGADLVVRLYIDGGFIDYAVVANGAIGEVTGSLIANIGAIRAAVDPAEAPPSAEGYGKLSGSIDEFRFWRTARTDKEIYRDWVTQVGVFGAGGTNTTDVNVDLGVYYKFNEGITGTSSVDSKVLDYSGRVSDGLWTGYTSTSRATGSAMVESGVALSEFQDPIIYSFHPDVYSLYANKQNSGSIYDAQNNASFYHSFPDYIIDEDNKGNLLNLTQIASNYLDALTLQIQELPKLKVAKYLTGSFGKPLPFANRLLEGMGFITSDIFSDADILANFLQRDEQLVFEDKICDIKNNIYTNIYNNLIYIYKSKGTEKSFRNLVRCFGIDDELIKINFYGNNVVYDLKTNCRYSSVKKKYADFNDPTRFEATVYQYLKASDSETISYLTGSSYAASGSAMTFETEVIFPKKFGIDSALYFETPFLSSSLFGVHTARTANTSDTTWNSPDYDFQVYAVRDLIDSKRAYFKLTSSYGKQFPLITSSLFNDVYDNQRWNFAVRIKPSRYAQNAKVSSSLWDTYILDFCGYNTVDNYTLNSFDVSSSLTFNQGSLFLASNKRLYVGAHRQNFSGSLIEKSDVKISSVGAWWNYLSDDDVLAHSYDATNFGIKRPCENAFLMNEALNNVYIPRIETLALHWDFASVTGSDSSGQFFVEDLSSGSASEVNRYNWLGVSTNYKHVGRGDSFAASDDQSVDVEYVYSAKQRLPETLDSSDMIEILERDDTTFTRDTRPVEFYTAIEKSMYQTISYEMINMFATIKDFNNLIGDPVNRYRQEYKDLRYLKSLFFEKVQNTPDIEKYVEFYKWIDASISNMIQQLIPLSANVSEDIRNVIESHILERNKYWNKFPTLEMKFDDPEDGMRGINELLYDWEKGSAPVSNLQRDHCLYWKSRASRTDPVLSSSLGMVNSSKDSIFDATYSTLDRSFSTPYEFGVLESDVVYSGINYPRNKKVEYIRSTLARALGLSTNEFVLSASSITQKIDCQDENDLNTKFMLNGKVQNIFEINDNSVYSCGDSDILLPFNIVSSSMDSTGYLRTVAETFMTGADFVNIHCDTYGSDKEVPMQSPFTERHVGGLQYRHIAFDGSVTGSERDRPEGWRMSFNSSGKTAYIRGAESAFGLLNVVPKAKYYRDEFAKRPVNIKNIKADYGNYKNDYEIVQTSGRKFNNRALVVSGGFDIPTSGSAYISGFIDYEKPSRGAYKHIFVERFSAPGGPDTAGDSDGGIGLDIEAAEYSVYNALNYRNMIVRTPLRTLLTRPCGQFGTDSVVGSVFPLTYESSASFHKVNKNTLVSMVLSGSNPYGSQAEYYFTGSTDDNWFIQHPIPQDDASYYWVTSSIFLSGSDV